MICRQCGKPLNKSQYSSDGRYKSCPRCSVLNGEEHIFFPYPSEFGTTEKRESVNHPDGPQSYCTNHRSDPDNPIQAGGVACSEI
jgi:phage FluMu protein Com